MGKRYSVINGAMPTTAPPTPVTTSATLFTLLQLKPSASSPLYLVQYKISFDGNALASPFPYDVVETDVGATVTAFAVADVMPVDDPNAPAQTAGTSGVPLNLGTTASGYTSSGEGSSTVNRTFDAGQAEPIGDAVFMQWPLGERPEINPGKFLRFRIKGDGTRKALISLIFET